MKGAITVLLALDEATNTLLMSAANGVICALDGNSGTKKWESSRHKHWSPQDHVTESLFVAGSVCVMISDRWLHGIDIGTGKDRFKDKLKSFRDLTVATGQKDELSNVSFDDASNTLTEKERSFIFKREFMIGFTQDNQAATHAGMGGKQMVIFLNCLMFEKVPGLVVASIEIADKYSDIDYRHLCEKSWNELFFEGEPEKK